MKIGPTSVPVLFLNRFVVRLPRSTLDNSLSRRDDGATCYLREEGNRYRCEGHGRIVLLECFEGTQEAMIPRISGETSDGLLC